MRKSSIFVGVIIGVAGVLCGLLTFWPSLVHSERMRAREAGRRQVQKLMLTDLCLFSEARYTRHPSQADLHAAFQDHPLSFEHFPSGSHVAPPQTVRNDDR